MQLILNMFANNFISKVLNTTKPFTQYSTDLRRLIHLQIIRNISIDKSRTARFLVNYPKRKNFVIVLLYQILLNYKFVFKFVLLYSVFIITMLEVSLYNIQVKRPYHNYNYQTQALSTLVFKVAYNSQGCFEVPNFFSQCRSMSNRSKSTDATEEIDLNEPVKFSTSKAASWNSHRIYLTPIGLGENVRPTYELFFMTFSMGIFLLYFLALREENDIDIKIDLEMHDRENSFKRKELQACIRIFKKKGKETKHLEEMLKQLEALKV
ncbi:hypothetical protein Avbf_03885 [Armadillidium vulgare]|nr:hypothetical protein Avbf_03885 [Armadillidium vulgare]